jgi:hypothetical protein
LYKHRETSICPFFAFTCQTADFAFPIGKLFLPHFLPVLGQVLFQFGPAATQIFADFFFFFFFEPLSLEQVDLIAFVEELFFSYKGCAGESDGGVDTVKNAKLPMPVIGLLFQRLMRPFTKRTIPFMITSTGF